MTTSAERLETTSFSTAILVLLLLVWALLAGRLRSGIIPPSAIASLLGLITGIFILIFHNYLSHAVVKKLLVFDSSSFLIYLLPPVIFNAGLGVHKKLFFGNLATILCMGIIGTLASFLIITVFLSALAGLRILRFQDCLALGAIFSATDSVATLQVLDSETMPLLFSLVFGEGIINDATSVVLFGAVSRVFPPSSNATALLSPLVVQVPGNTSAGGSNISSSSSPSMNDDGGGNHSAHELGLAASFLYLYTTSTVLGLATGVAIAYLLKHVKTAGAHQEMVLVGMLSYLSYLVAELIGLSGILCLFCCGIAVSHWALPQMTPLGCSCTSEAFHALSHLAEGVIFIYVGMDALDPVKWKAAYLPEMIPLCFTVLLLLLVSRAVGVIPVALLHNLWGSQGLNWRDLAIIWWAGLMRGAVSVALVYSYFDSQNLDSHRATIISSTLVTVLFTTVVLGILTKPFLALLLEEQPDQALRAIWNRAVRKILVPWRRMFGYQTVSGAQIDVQAPADLVEISMQQTATRSRNPEDTVDKVDGLPPRLASRLDVKDVKSG